MILDTRLSKAIEKHLNDNDEEINPLDEILRLIHENDELDEMNFEEGDLLGEEIDAFIDAVHDSDVHACEELDFILEIAKESEIDLVSLLKHISKRLHEPMPEPEYDEPIPEPENEPIPEPEYDEPIPENYHDLMQKLEQGIDFLVEDLLYEFRLSDDELRSMLTRILNNPNPANHSDELRGFIEAGDTVDDVVERIEYHHLDINEVVDYALYNLNLRRRRPRLYYE